MLMALCEHSAKLFGKALHFFVKGFVVFGFFFYANITAWGKDVVLLGDVFRFNSGTETFCIFQSSVLESSECVGKAV